MIVFDFNNHVDLFQAILHVSHKAPVLKAKPTNGCAALGCGRRGEDLLHSTFLPFSAFVDVQTLRHSYRCFWPSAGMYAGGTAGPLLVSALLAHLDKSNHLFYVNEFFFYMVLLEVKK